MQSGNVPVVGTAGGVSEDGRSGRRKANGSGAAVEQTRRETLRAAVAPGGRRHGGSGGGGRRRRDRIERRRRSDNGGGVGRRRTGEGGGERERTEEHMWRVVHQIPIQEGGERWRYQGQEGPGRERRGVGRGTARDRKLRAGWARVLGVQVQDMEYMEVPEGTGKRRVAQEAGRGG